MKILRRLKIKSLKKIITGFILIVSTTTLAQQTPFEKSGGIETATYFEAIDWYKKLDSKSTLISVKTMGATDAGYPLHLVLISNDGTFVPARWHQQKKVVIMINNGIHPGEPDGIDASMMLTRDIVNKKIILPSNVVVAIIPVYNIGGCLNRNAYTRANQNGPREYGFRGNSQNLDLNRDFTKSDSKEARSFAEIFHFLSPDILIDNHVSDGADFQHTMTLISTQYDKLGPVLGKWLRESFEPKLYTGMASKGWEMIPYVDFGTTDFEKGMKMFMDPPRYSSGYAALFNTLAFMPETHMLKPFKERVAATYDLMSVFIAQASVMSAEIKSQRTMASGEWKRTQKFPLKWQPDSTIFSEITFKGYQTNHAGSEATGLQKMYYDHSRPFTSQVKYYHKYIPSYVAEKPRAYIIPQGWHTVIDLLRINKVSLSALTRDTTMKVKSYRVADYKSSPRPYEKHHKNFDILLRDTVKEVRFLKGDLLVYMNQPANRYLVEMLEPMGDDSFFAWNFFDGILQQKEGYSDYRWEDLAAEVVRKDTVLQKKLSEKKAKDPVFAADAGAILDFIYKNSPFYEKAFMQYPVYRIEF
jgi:hypothetical protein